MQAGRGTWGLGPGAGLQLDAQAIFRALVVLGALGSRWQVTGRPRPTPQGEGMQCFTTALWLGRASQVVDVGAVLNVDSGAWLPAFSLGSATYCPGQVGS